MTNFKWADVAHYYTKSPIGAMVNGVKRVVASMDSDGIIYTDEPPSHGQGVTVCPESVEIGEYTPILRHRYDITEAEARELFEVVHGYVAEGRFSIMRWAKDHLDMDRYSPRVVFWLISKGFDVFDLIEAGEAIRKEKTV